jgi:hypothetical protein
MLDLAESPLIEKVACVGDTVTSAGINDATRAAIEPKCKRETALIKLVTGAGHEMVLRQTKRPWAILAFSILWSGFAHSFILVALAASQRQ